MQNFTPVGARGWKRGPQNGKKIHFLVNSRPVGRMLWPISKIVRGIYTPNSPAKLFQIWRDLLLPLQSYCWETARRSFTPNFSMHPVGKTMRWIEKWLHLFGDLSVLCCRAKFGEDRATRACCRCENVVFVFRLDAWALSIIATATWQGGWLGDCHTPVLYQNG